MSPIVAVWCRRRRDLRGEEEHRSLDHRCGIRLTLSIVFVLGLLHCEFKNFQKFLELFSK